jgi:hypothetical protein
MTEQWYYTANGQQMGPVSYPDLQQMAADGRLHPGDLVWTEGMHQWAPANTTRGLFASRGDAPAADSDRPAPPRPGAEPERWAPAGRGAPPGPPRPRPQPPAGMSARAKAALVGGVSAFVLLIVVVLILLVVLNRPPADVNVPIVNGRGAYTVRLHDGGRDTRNIQFNANSPVNITVETDSNTDVGLEVFDGFNNRIVVDHGHRGRNPRVHFFAQRTEFYRVVVINHGPGPTRCIVRCN